MSRRTVLVAGAVLVVVVVAIVLAGQSSSSTGGPPLSPTSTAADGTKALAVLLERYGAVVRAGGAVPPADASIALVLRDRLDEARRSQLRRWVEGGGTLVVADRRSPLAAPGAGSTDADRLERATCNLAGLEGVEQLQLATGSLVAAGSNLFEVGPRQQCFGAGRTAFIVGEQRGSGRVVSIGGPALFTNELLGELDNSVLAVRLLAPQVGVRVALVDPSPAGAGETSLVDLVPTRVVQAILQLLVAFVVYALFRSRRLGRPVSEPQPVAIAGSGLVRAVGRLRQRTGGAPRAGAALREDVRRALVRRYGLPAAAPATTVADVAARRTGLDAERVRWALAGPPVTDDAALVALAAELDVIRQEVLDVRG